MINEKLLATLVARIVSQTRVNSPKGQSSDDYVKGILSKLFTYIDCINSLPERASRIDDVSLSDIVIMDEFKGFILPSSVKVDPSDLNAEDLMIKPAISSKFSYEQFINCQLAIRSWFKSDLKTNVTHLDQLRRKISLFDALPNAAFKLDSGELVCRYTDKPFVPIQLWSDLNQLYRENYFNATYDNVLTDYCLDLFM